MLSITLFGASASRVGTGEVSGLRHANLRRGYPPSISNRVSVHEEVLRTCLIYSLPNEDYGSARGNPVNKLRVFARLDPTANA